MVETKVAWKSSVAIVTCVLSVAGVSGFLCMWQSYCPLLHQLLRSYRVKVASLTAAWTPCPGLDMRRALRLTLPCPS